MNHIIELPNCQTVNGLKVVVMAVLYRTDFIIDNGVISFNPLARQWRKHGFVKIFIIIEAELKNGDMCLRLTDNGWQYIDYNKNNYNINPVKVIYPELRRTTKPIIFWKNIVNKLNGLLTNKRVFFSRNILVTE